MAYITEAELDALEVLCKKDRPSKEELHKLKNCGWLAVGEIKALRAVVQSILPGVIRSALCDGVFAKYNLPPETIPILEQVFKKVSASQLLHEASSLKGK